MPQDLYAAYNSLSVARKKEAYDFIMRLSYFEKNKEPKLSDFFGSINAEDSDKMLEALKECSRIEATRFNQ